MLEGELAAPVVDFQPAAFAEAVLERLDGPRRGGAAGMPGLKSVEETIAACVKANGCPEAPGEESLPDRGDDASSCRTAPGLRPELIAPSPSGRYLSATRPRH